MKTSIVLSAGLEFLTINCQAQTMTAIDGNCYNVITTCTREWLKEKLKTTHHHTGDPIPNIAEHTTWSGLKTGAYSN